MKVRNIGSNQTEVETERARVLFSYATPVAAANRTEEHYSVTTSKHINKWLDGRNAKKVPQVELDRLLEVQQDGESGQDRESYSDDQDRESYTVNEVERNP